MHNLKILLWRDMDVEVMAGMLMLACASPCGKKRKEKKEKKRLRLSASILMRSHVLYRAAQKCASPCAWTGKQWLTCACHLRVAVERSGRALRLTDSTACRLCISCQMEVHICQAFGHCSVTTSLSILSRWCFHVKVLVYRHYKKEDRTRLYYSIIPTLVPYSNQRTPSARSDNLPNMHS